MIVKVSIPNRFQFKTAPGFRTMLMQKQGEVHYIGGADICVWWYILQRNLIIPA